ncbi:flagellar protein [Methylobacterium sp. NEAU 140]|uniref:flagellar protein n=1 Tax=Methylobacterium sp. NEAU 140 TaxID=3064945 RepID=UPI0027332241|nr:flagellar protein [Methylobacterium sp. NEAU 140]MDP4025958.1 flagellar protein [Methylobacterium sp. NEAU 140]
MLDALHTATGGLISASRGLDAAARTIAGTETGAETGIPAGSAALPPAARVDLSGAVGDLVGARAAFGLNAAVIRTADRMTDRLLDITV